MSESEERFKEIRDFYNDEYYANVEDNGPKRIAWHYRWIASKLGALEGLNVLDVACGTGEWLSLLSTGGAKPNGIDISSRAIEVCKRRFGDHGFHVGLAESLPFGSNSFDLVSCLGSIEHFLDPSAALAEMVRVSKQNATFLLLVPNSEFLPRKIGLYKGTQQTKVREITRSVEEWSALFDQAGLRVKRRWKDLHTLTSHWIKNQGLVRAPLRMGGATLLPLLPIRWQYQVYHLCERKPG